MDNGRQMRFTDEELTLLRSTFQDNEKLIKLLRKVFLPEYDPNAPIGQVVDLWVTLPVDKMEPDEAIRAIQVRNDLIKHVEQQINQISFLVAQKKETPEEVAMKTKLNSTK